MNRTRNTAVWLRRVLNLALGLMLLFALLAVVLCAVALVGASRGRPVENLFPVDVAVALDLDPGSLLVDAPGLDGTRIDLIRTEGTLRAQTGEPRYLVSYCLILLAVLAVVILELVLLRRILDTVIRGRPFAFENVRRIRWIGLIVIGWSVLSPAGRWLWASWVLRAVETRGGRLTPPFDFDPDQLWIGFGILVLAEVFHRGTQLEEDRSLTI